METRPMSDQAVLQGNLPVAGSGAAPAAAAGVGGAGAAAPIRPQVPAAEIPGLNGLLTLAVAVVVVSALYFGKEVLVPITLAVLLSFVLAPLVAFLRRIHVPRAPSAILAVLVALGIILAMGSVIGAQLASLAADLPRYQTTISEKVSAVRGFTVGRLSELMANVGRQVERAAPPTDRRGAAQEPAPGASRDVQPVPVEVREPTPSPVEVAQRLLTPIVGPIETTLIVLVVCVFVLLQKEDLRDRLIRLFGSGDLHRTTAAMDEAGYRLSRYFLCQLGLNAAFGCFVAGALLLIGLPSPLLWGILAGLLRFVPYIGSVIASVLPVALAAAVDPGWHTVLWTVALFAVAEPFMGQVVEPLVYGNSTGLSPVSVVIAAIFWTWLWGPIGLLLSTPLTLCLVVLGRHVQRLEFLDVLLGDRPALTPIESFYQRMLAGDPDEAHEQAEQLLKERPLSSYYDEVALKGLQLAAADARRGVLAEAQVVRMREAVCELIEDLDGHADSAPPAKAAPNEPPALSLVEKALPSTAPPGAGLPAPAELPPAWREPGAVLCVAGRGPLDEAASSMLAQLLGKHGMGARTAWHELTSRSGIGQLDPDGIAMVCISYLELTGTPTHLRYLLRRLRRRLPGVPVLVGLWPAEDAVLADERLRAVLGADHYVSSLREAVNACLREAAPAGASAEHRTTQAAAGTDATAAPNAQAAA